jgi:hypothetical protein
MPKPNKKLTKMLHAALDEAKLSYEHGRMAYFFVTRDSTLEGGLDVWRQIAKFAAAQVKAGEDAEKARERSAMSKKDPYVNFVGRNPYRMPEEEKPKGETKIGQENRGAPEGMQQKCSVCGVEGHKAPTCDYRA